MTPFNEIKSIIPVSSDTKTEFKANHFLAIRVCNKNILDNIEVFQAYQMMTDESLKKFVKSSVKAHVTLNVLQLDSKEEVDKCIKLLTENFKIKANEKTTLRFQGIGKFGKKIVYAKPIKGAGEEILQSIFTDINKVLVDGGIKVEKKKKYNPHITLFKAPRRQNKVIEINTDQYKNFLFGEESVNEILLLSINKKADKAGFYFQEAAIPLY